MRKTLVALRAMWVRQERRVEEPVRRYHSQPRRGG